MLNFFQNIKSYFIIIALLFSTSVIPADHGVTKPLQLQRNSQPLPLQNFSHSNQSQDKAAIAVSTDLLLSLLLYNNQLLLRRIQSQLSVPNNLGSNRSNPRYNLHQLCRDGHVAINDMPTFISEALNHNKNSIVELNEQNDSMADIIIKNQKIDDHQTKQALEVIVSHFSEHWSPSIFAEERLERNRNNSQKPKSMEYLQLLARGPAAQAAQSHQ